MNSVKMNLVALLVSVVFLGCSGLNQVKDSPENKILGQWRIFSRELPSINACEDNILKKEACENLDAKYSVFADSRYLMFNNQNELVGYYDLLEQEEVGKIKYSVKGKQFIITDKGKEVAYKFSFENDILVIYLSNKDFLKLKSVRKISKVSEPEKIPQMQPVLLFLKALEQSDITLFEKTLSREMKNKEEVDKEFRSRVQRFQERKDKSKHIEFIFAENNEKEGTIFVRVEKNPCLDVDFDVIKEVNIWKIQQVMFGGCAAQG